MHYYSSSSVTIGLAPRDKPRMDVRVGGHRPQPGGSDVRRHLGVLLGTRFAGKLSPFDAHRAYETLHPLMDCSGCCGRGVWLWQMGRPNREHSERVTYRDLGFLHSWHYQSLAGKRAT